MSKIVVIIGGGAAGIFAALHVKAERVIVLEKTKQLLTKVKISGGGRCNVTHSCFDPKQLVNFYPRGGKELLGAFHRFQPKETMRFFEERAVPLKTEEDGRIFPKSDSSQTIIDALLKEAERRSVEIRRESSVSHIHRKEQFEIQLSDGAKFFADALILATGSSPQGQRLAESLGHTIIPPVPSLFSLNLTEKNSLSPGVTVDDLAVSLDGKKFQRGATVITHWGMSGPAILKLSAFEARTLHDQNYQGTLTVDWLPALTEGAVQEKIATLSKAKTVGSDHPFSFSKSVWQALLERAEIPLEKRVAHLSKEEIKALVTLLKRDRYPFDGKTTYKEEFVTAGGVSLKEVDFRTMESKITPRLYFAGELLDIDGVTGGFNFQAAWTTGFIAGSSA